MFRSAALKLTLWYLAIIMAIGASFSFALYRISSDDLERNARRQVTFFRNNLSPPDFNTYVRLRERQLRQDLAHLRDNLLLFNFIVLLVGGAGSYALARKTLRPIEEALENQQRFAGDASHELRTPLAAMQAEIEVALRNSRLSRNQTVELLESNLEEVAKLRDLADGLLRLTAANRRQNFKQTVSLKSVVEQSVQRWKKIAQANDIKIEVDVADVKTRGDQQSLIDLLSILLDNAIKYSQAGSTVYVKGYRKDRSVRLSVADSGIGIKAKELPRIFERFYRTDSSRAKASAGGYGLGLAIAKKIVDLHGGSIEVKSAPGKGSIFTVQLPKV